VPVLVVSGDDGEEALRRSGVEFSGVGRHTLALMAGCGQLPMVERPALFGWTVLRWLAQQRSRTMQEV